ncbi:MAG: chloride channel protein [Planctomycetota bacterium]
MAYSPGTPSNALSLLSKRLGFAADWYLIGIGALVGTLTGAGAVGFAEVLHLLEGLVERLQLGELLPLPGGGLAWLVITPVIGMFLTGLLVHFFASEAKGHGVPQVLLALIKRGGRIPARIGVVKTIASILTVGSGGSAGTEGPIVQIGSTAGSQLGKALRLNEQGVRTLVGCGAAAGISSIFNAPIAGVFFVLEILLRDFSVKIFTPIVVASVFSQVTTQAMLSDSEAIFATGELLRGLGFQIAELPSYIVLGLVCGLVAIAFNRTLHRAESLYDKWNIHPLLKPVTGALGLGALGVGFVLLVQNLGVEGGELPPFYGGGYAFIREVIDTESYGFAESSSGLLTFSGAVGIAGELELLALVVLLKLVATALTLASGGSGGVFAPSLFLGAAAGAVSGVTLQSLGLLPPGSTPASYALVGMAAVVAASTHAPLTAILILFELTQDFRVVLPIMLSAVIATVLAQLAEPDSIYTHRLRKLGVLVGRARDQTLLRSLTVSEVKRTPLAAEPIYPSDPLSKVVELHARNIAPDFAITSQDGVYVGLVSGADVRSALIDREAIPLLLVAELVRPEIPTISVDETLDSVMRKFAKHDVSALCLASPPADGQPFGKPVALVTRTSVLQRYQAALEADAAR